MRGYKEKPIIIELISLIYLLNPIGNIMFIIFFSTNGEPIKNLNTLMNLIFVQANPVAVINFIFWISAIPLAYGLFTVHLWAWYYFLIHATGMFVLSFFDAYMNIAPSFSTFINMIFLIPIGYMISHEIRTPYFNPNLKWWAQSKRFHHTVTIEISGTNFDSFDISADGAFVIDLENKNDVEVEEYMPIKLHLDDTKIDCFGEVRWINSEKGKYPYGFGLKFDKLSLSDKLKIKQFTKSLSNEGRTQTR